MENESGNGQYKKIGIAAATLFILMIVGFFVFVYFDNNMPADHGAEPAAQVEEHAAPSDHAGSDDPSASDDHSASEDHAPAADHAPSDDHAPADGHGEETTH